MPAAGVYGQLWRYASIIEARRVLIAGCCSTALIVGVDLIHRYVPLTVALVAGLAATMFVGLARFQTRLISFRRREQDEQGHPSRAGLHVVVVGAGRSGAELIRQMKSHDHSGLVPVGVVDDDRHTWGRSLHGVRVKGASRTAGPAGRARRPPDRACRWRGHTRDGDRTRRDRRCLRRGIAHPACVGRRTGPHRPASARPARPQHRRPARPRAGGHRLPAVCALLHGRRVLVTGGGGSIGSEIARQVAGCGPAGSCCSTTTRPTCTTRSTTCRARRCRVLADIRDASAVDAVFRRHRPDVVFHAAAHKHVPILETHPCEAVPHERRSAPRNVVDGCARGRRARTSCCISTDKAVHPSSVMGASKWLAEQIVLERAAPSTPRTASVRFGNVLGSRGSVIPTFQRRSRPAARSPSPTRG